MYSYYPQTAAATVVSTEGRVWNGSSWGAVASGNVSTPVVTQQPSLVQLYTDYYNGYQTVIEQAQAEADRYGDTSASPSHSAQRDEWLRRVNWYKYYADQASRAAHYYYQNANVSSPPSFELPPPPPTTVVQNTTINSSVRYQDSSPSIMSSNSLGNQPHAVAIASNASLKSSSPTSLAASSSTSNHSSSATPDGLKRFFHACLQECGTDQEREEVQGKLEQLIAKSIQNGTLHTTNWDALERIPPSSRQNAIGDFSALHHQPNTATHASDSPCDGGATAFAARQNKRTWQEIAPELACVTNGNDPPATMLGTQTNKRSRFQATFKQENLGNRDYGHSKTISQTPSLTDITRVTPPLETTSSLNYYGNSSHHQFEKQQLAVNDSYYGPASSPSQSQKDSSSTTSGGSEEDFVPVPKFMRGGKAKTARKSQNGFSRSQSMLAARANRFGDTRITLPTITSSDNAASNFDKYMGKGMIGGSNRKLEEADYEKMTVKGTCTRLEKEYLRLTAPPRAELVRPQHILKQHFDDLVSEWDSRDRHEYLWFCSQFKAMRQDCRVQRIQNAFTVRVYETHARIALQSSDLNEFNQCQTQLMELYDMLLSPSYSSTEQEAIREHRNEFLAYRFIYYVFLTGNHKGSSSSDLMALMLSLTPQQWRNPAIAHAAQVREAVASQDYHAFFRLEKDCPNLSAYLVNLMVPLIRLNALQRICKAYRPSIEVNFVLAELGFNDCEMMDGIRWLESCGCILKGDVIMTKESVVRESDLQVKQSLI